MLAWCYPVVTFVVIIITANHYILDAVGGLVVLAVGWFLANWSRGPAGRRAASARSRPASRRPDTVA